MSLTDDTWKWYWRKSDDGNEADCGIYVETRVGAYAIARCPRYVSKEDWEAIATRICDLHNAALQTVLARGTDVGDDR
jgi:hypothetical protein